MPSFSVTMLDGKAWKGVQSCALDMLSALLWPRAGRAVLHGEVCSSWRPGPEAPTCRPAPCTVRSEVKAASAVQQSGIVCVRPAYADTAL